MRSLWWTNKEIAEIYRRNVRTVFHVCILFFKGNAHDAEDAVQTKQLYNAPDGEFEKIISGNSVKDVALILSIFRERAIGLRE